MNHFLKLITAVGLCLGAMAGTQNITTFEMSVNQAETNRSGDPIFYYCGNVTGVRQNYCKGCNDDIPFKCSGQNPEACRNRSNEAFSETSSGAHVNNNFNGYNQVVSDSKFGSGSASGCKPCGAGMAGLGNIKDLGLKRHLDARKPDAPGDFGVGSRSNYDYKIKFHIIGDALIADLDGPGLLFSMRLVDGRNGDTKDGVFHDQLNATIDEMQLLDINGNLTMDFSQAVKADLYNRSRELMSFEIFQIGSDYYGRITDIKDRNNRGMTIVYKTWTPAEITASPERQWQRHTVTNAHGRVTTFNYDTTMIAGGYVISSVTLPNGEQVSYSYTQDTLSAVTYPDSTQSTYTYGTGVGNFTELTISEVSGETKKIHMSSNMTGTIVGGSGINPEGVSVWNQASMLVKTVEVNGEVRYHYTGNPDRENDRYIYEGKGVVKKIHNSNYCRYAEGNITVPDSGAWKYENMSMGDEVKYGFWPGAPTNLFVNAPAKLFDAQRREYDYEYTGINSLSKKTYTDSSFEEWEYNAFRQITRYRDRLGRVTKHSYDSRGNIISTEVGLLDIGGVDTPTAEYAVYNKEYYPSGHANEFLLRYEFDANTNRTEYIYNSDDLLIEIKKPDDAGSSYHVEQSFSYDSQKRLQTSTDAVGRTVEYEYDDQERVIKITYFNDTEDTELFFYGTGSQSDKLIKKKDRNGFTTKMSYDSAGRVVEIISSYSTMDEDGSNESVLPASVQSIETCTYVPGTNVKASCTVNGDLTEYEYDYRRRRVKTIRYADDNSALISSSTYKNNLLFNTEDPYGFKTYYNYRSSDSAMIRTIKGTAVSFSKGDFSGVASQARDLGNNANFLITDYELDAEGQTTATIDPRGIRHETDFDSRGRVTYQVSDAGGLEQTTQTLYDDNSNVTEVRSPRYFSESINDRTTMTYTRRNLLASRTVAAGSAIAATESFTYYLDGREDTHTDFRGNTSTKVWKMCCGRLGVIAGPVYTDKNSSQRRSAQVMEYDFHGNVTHTAVLDWDGTAALPPCCYPDPLDSATLQEVTTLYDERHRPIARTVWLDPLGSVDPNAVPIFGNPGAPAGKTGLTTRWIYFDETDGHAALQPLIDELDADGITLGTDNDGSAVITINPQGEVSVAIMDGVGRTVASGMYDSQSWIDFNNATGSLDLVTWNSVIHDNVVNGLLETKSISALGFENKVHSDGAGRRIKAIDALGKNSTFEYDANSNLVKSRDANSVGMDCIFDNLNRDTSCTDTDGDTVAKTFDLNNNVTAQTDAKLKSSTTLYDERNRTSSATDRNSGVTSYTYDDASNVETITDSLGKVTAYEYDSRNLQVKVTYPDHIIGQNPGDANYGITECNYDALNRKDICIDQLGDTVTYNYDLASRLTSREYHSGGSTLESTDTFTYDSASRLLSAYKGRYANLVTVTYDGIGRKETETTSVGSNDYTVIHTYDDDNRITNCQYPSGNNVSKTYTDRNQLLGIDFNAANVIDFTYDDGMREATRTFGNSLVTTSSYNNDNTKSGIAVAGQADLSFAYTYDANKNVTAETSTGTVMDLYDWSASFDDIDRVTGWNRTDAANPDSQTWTLDKIGNWSNTTGTLGGSSFNENRTHNDAHELTAMGANGLAYDAKGNMTTDANGSSLLWDIDNHLKEMTIGGSNITLTYDALGRRVEKLSPALNTLFISSGQQVIEEYENQGAGYNLRRSYIYGSYIDDVVAKVEVPASLYEAENAALNGPSILTSSITSGGAFIDYSFASGETVTFTVNADSTGTHNLAIRFVLAAAARDLELRVDGIYEDTITFPSTGTWSNWQTMNYAIDLTAGSHTLEFKTIASVGGPNLDCIELGSGNPQIHYYHSDRQFNVRGLTDSSGDAVELYAYSVYGKQSVLSPTGSVLAGTAFNNKYGFTGRYWNEETGLWYFRARYFNDEMGRFISRDPLGYVDGMSLYNGYFAEGFKLDPMGKELRKTELNEVPKDGDTDFRPYIVFKYKYLISNKPHNVYKIADTAKWTPFTLTNNKATLTAPKGCGIAIRIYADPAPGWPAGTGNTYRKTPLWPIAFDKKIAPIGWVDKKTDKFTAFYYPVIIGNVIGHNDYHGDSQIWHSTKTGGLGGAMGMAKAAKWRIRDYYQYPKTEPSPATRGIWVTNNQNVPFTIAVNAHDWTKDKDGNFVKSGNTYFQVKHKININFVFK